jgi:hypothetical protein
MADNVAVTPGAGATFAADDVGGILHPRVKISIGADGTAADWPVGSGNQSAVPRVTLATDSPGVITTGTAGTPSAVVLSVQGVASGTNLPVALQPTTAGGCTISSTLIASGTNATSVKASAGQLYKIEVTNNSANIGYLKLYNTAGTPTAGSGTPVIRLMCPGSASGTGAFSTYDNGVAFGTGIGFTFTGGIADADTTSVAASAFIVNLYYK